MSFEGRTVNGMCLSDTGDVLGYVALDEMPLEWESQAHPQHGATGPGKGRSLL